MSEPFDIDDVKLADTAELAIAHPSSGLPTTWIWTVAGPAHPKTVEASNLVMREMLRIQKLKDQAQANRKKWVEPDRSPDEVRLENIKTFAKRVLGWTPARIGGADYPYSYENVVKLLDDRGYDKIYTQLLEFFTSDEAFTKPSVTTSQNLQSEITS